MSEFENNVNEVPATDPVEAARREIDDLLDIVEEKISNIKLVPLKMAAVIAVNSVRSILSIPDDIGGDID